MIKRDLRCPQGDSFHFTFTVRHADDCGDECLDGCPVVELDGQSNGASRFFTVTEWDDMDDIRSAALALARAADDDGARSDLDGVINALGFDRSQLEAELVVESIFDFDS